MILCDAATDDESYDDYDDYEDEYPDEYDNYDDNEEQIPMPDPTIGTSTTARVTEAPTVPIVTESNSGPCRLEFGNKWPGGWGGGP